MKLKYLEDPDVTLYHGDCLEVLRTLPDRSVHMCATSPPFFGLRDYGTGTWEGGDEGCDHTKPNRAGPTTLHLKSHGGHTESSAKATQERQLEPYGAVCGKCGAVRTDRQIGLEESPDEWVARLVEVFREVRRVLRDDGTLWVEIGDSYSSGGRGTYPEQGADWERPSRGALGGAPRPPQPDDVKPKDLLGQPWLLAFALRADGWYLRSEIIWARPNPMPESVTDRPTKAHSTVFLLSKSPRYFYDAEAIREPSPAYTAGWARSVAEQQRGNGETSQRGPGGGVHRMGELGNGANARSVWNIATEPTPFAHFATWPQKLCRRMIQAGTSERGVCPECGAPWVREVERTAMVIDRSERTHSMGHTRSSGTMVEPASAKTIGWVANCDLGCTLLGDEFRTQNPATVLDPFGGSGTTALVARKLGRKAILIELNESYCELASSRLAQQSLFAVADD